MTRAGWVIASLCAFVAAPPTAWAEAENNLAAAPRNPSIPDVLRDVSQYFQAGNTRCAPSDRSAHMLRDKGIAFGKKSSQVGCW
jgi:hypothetical protein